MVEKAGLLSLVDELSNGRKMNRHLRWHQHEGFCPQVQEEPDGQWEIRDATRDI